ncbi:hypothetical protein C0W35_21235 [Photobacterium kishitanii]|nr:hypothetical protein C0W35_21235 [Photobacterium kishitanii]
MSETTIDVLHFTFWRWFVTEIKLYNLVRIKFVMLNTPIILHQHPDLKKAAKAAFLSTSNYR